jgi:hypothetical protein
MLYWKTMFPDKPRGYKPSPAIIRQNMLRLLYNPQKDARRTEMLTIIVPKSKEKHYKFLDAYTKFPAHGKWKQFDEANSVLEVQFQETPDDRVGKSLITLVGLYNRSVVGEQVPYAYTKHVDESTLVQDLDKDGVPDYEDCEPLDPTKQDTPLWAMTRGRESVGESLAKTPEPKPEEPKAEAPKHEPAKVEPPKPEGDGIGMVVRGVKGIAGELSREEQAIEKGIEEFKERRGKAREAELGRLETKIREKELKQRLKELRVKPKPEAPIEAPAPRPRAERKSRVQRKLEKLQTKLETERIQAELRELQVRKTGTPEGAPRRRRKKRKSKKLQGFFGLKI